MSAAFFSSVLCVLSTNSTKTWALFPVGSTLTVPVGISSNNYTLYSGRRLSSFSCVCLAQHWFKIYKLTYAHGSPEGDGWQPQCPSVIGLFMPAALIYLARDLSSLCQPTKPLKLKAHWPLLSILSFCLSRQINVIHPDNLSAADRNPREVT